MRGRQIVSVKDQRVAILGFAGLSDYVAYTQLGQHSMKAAIDNT